MKKITSLSISWSVWQCRLKNFWKVKNSRKSPIIMNYIMGNDKTLTSLCREHSLYLSSFSTNNRYPCKEEYFLTLIKKNVIVKKLLEIIELISVITSPSQLFCRTCCNIEQLSPVQCWLIIARSRSVSEYNNDRNINAAVSKYWLAGWWSKTFYSFSVRHWLWMVLEEWL